MLGLDCSWCCNCFSFSLSLADSCGFSLFCSCCLLCAGFTVFPAFPVVFLLYSWVCSLCFLVVSLNYTYSVLFFPVTILHLSPCFSCFIRCVFDVFPVFPVFFPTFSSVVLPVLFLCPKRPVQFYLSGQQVPRPQFPHDYVEMAERLSGFAQVRPTEILEETKCPNCTVFCFSFVYLFYLIIENNATPHGAFFVNNRPTQCFFCVCVFTKTQWSDCC